MVKLLSRLYADDLSCSVDTADKGLDVYKRSKEILAKGSFNLRKFRTNDADLLAQINELEGNRPSGDVSKMGVSQVSEDDQSFAQYSVGPPNSDKHAKVLGVNWNTETDKLFFNLSQIRVLAKTLPPLSSILWVV